MGELYENLIEYSGVSEYIPKNLKSYKEVDIESIINFSKGVVKLKEIVKVSVTSSIKSYRVIETPKSTSLEGQELTGKKGIIEGKLCLRIEYLTVDKSNKIYCLYYDTDFCAGIILHKDIVDSNKLIPTLFVEGIHSDVLGEEQILIITTIIATVEE